MSAVTRRIFQGGAPAPVFVRILVPHENGHILLPKTQLLVPLLPIASTTACDVVIGARNRNRISPLHFPTAYM